MEAREQDGEEKQSESRSEEHTSELQSLTNLVCRLLLEKKKNTCDQRNYARSFGASLRSSNRARLMSVMVWARLILSPCARKSPSLVASKPCRPELAASS